jgi:hypothetical protein
MSNILIPRAEEIMALRPGFSAADIKEVAREAYLKGTADHIPVQWVSAGIVEKWDPDQVAFAQRELGSEVSREDLYRIIGEPEITEDPPSNLLLNAGITRMLNLLIGTASLGVYSNAKSRVGVGNSATAESASQTDLQASAGASNRYYQAVNGSYPSVSSQTLTAQSTFATGDGNFVWAEWGIDGGGASSAVVGTFNTTDCGLLNRKVAALGTKASGASWTLTVTITIS